MTHTNKAIVIIENLEDIQNQQRYDVLNDEALNAVNGGITITFPDYYDGKFMSEMDISSELGRRK